MLLHECKARKNTIGEKVRDKGVEMHTRGAHSEGHGNVDSELWIVLLGLSVVF